jgi:hypothetical protein
VQLVCLLSLYVIPLMDLRAIHRLKRHRETFVAIYDGARRTSVTLTSGRTTITDPLLLEVRHTYVVANMCTCIKSKVGSAGVSRVTGD